MPVATDPDEPDDDLPELTPAQREKLRKSMEDLSQAIAPIDFGIQNIVGPALSKLAADMVKIPTFTLPESTLKNIAAISGIAGQHSKIVEAFNPNPGEQAGWQKQLSFIDSDFFKAHAATQSQFAKLAAQVTKSIDFGLSDTFAKIAQQVAASQSAWLKNIRPSLFKLTDGFYPPNIRGIEGLRFMEVEEVVMADGIALYNVPRRSIAEALIHADTAAKRREILGRRRKAISTDCRGVAEGCQTKAVTPYASVALHALDALDAGHYAAAQALTGSLLDSIVNTYFGGQRHLYTPDKHGKRTNAAYDQFGAHEFIAFAPVWQAWQKFFPNDGKPIPHTFSRNATAHTVSTRQYSRRNATQSLMIVAGILAFLEEHAAP